ncbi:MAG TPA: hypothetical protein VII99_13780 [Bacteroidia bacterium]
MKKFFLFLRIVSTSALFSQNYASYPKQVSTDILTNEFEFNIYSVEYKDAKMKMDNFIQKNKFEIVKQEETKFSHYYEIDANTSKLSAIDSFVQTLGYISSKELKSFNNQAKLEETKLELEHLNTKKKEYEKMLQRMDSVKSDKYYQHWEKIRDIESEIYSTKKQIKELESVSDVCRVKIRINDDQTSPTNSAVSFVHMPGAEYSYLFIENPKSGISYDNYQGVNLKYLFTKGKSYFSLGALKAMNASGKDSTSYNELFNFAFGQDWYSRFLGRGTRKFFNLYVGYQVGVSLAHNLKYTQTIPFASPSTGIELFKNKYFLIDSNVHYYLPVSNENQNLRGWRVSASINFVF